MIGPDAHGGVFIEQGRETSLLVDDPDARFQFHARDVPVFLKDGAGAEPAMAFDALPQGVRLIVRIRGHGFARLKAGHADLGGTEPFGGDGGIHGDVSASDDEHVSGQAGLFVAPVGAQELKAPVDAGKLDAFHAYLAADRRSGGQHDGFESQPFQVGKAQVRVFADLRIAAEGDAHRFKPGDVGRNDRVGKPIRGDAVPQHAAGKRHRLENRHRIPHLCEEPRAGKPRRAGADYRDLCDVPSGGPFERSLQIPVAHDLLDGIDFYRLVHMVPGALFLAGMETYPARDGRKRLDAAVAPGRFAKVPLLDQVMVAANVDPGGASRHARGKGLLRGFEPENIQWACLGAGSAAGTGRRIDAVDHMNSFYASDWEGDCPCGDSVSETWLPPWCFSLVGKAILKGNPPLGCMGTDVTAAKCCASLIKSRQRVFQLVIVSFLLFFI